MTGAAPGRAIVAPVKRPHPVVASRGGSCALDAPSDHRHRLAVALCVLPAAAQARPGFVPPSSSTSAVARRALRPPAHEHQARPGVARRALRRAGRTPPAVVAVPRTEVVEGRRRLRLGRRHHRRWRRADPDRGPWRRRARHPPAPRVGLRLSRPLHSTRAGRHGPPGARIGSGRHHHGRDRHGAVDACSRARRPGSSRRARGRPSPSAPRRAGTCSAGSALAVAQTPNWKSCGVGWKPRAWSGLKPSWPVSTTREAPARARRPEAGLRDAERDVARDPVARDAACRRPCCRSRRRSARRSPGPRSAGSMRRQRRSRSCAAGTTPPSRSARRPARGRRRRRAGRPAGSRTSASGPWCLSRKMICSPASKTWNCSMSYAPGLKLSLVG